MNVFDSTLLSELLTVNTCSTSRDLKRSVPYALSLHNISVRLVSAQEQKARVSPDLVGCSGLSQS